MVQQGLAPGVQHGGDANLRVQVVAPELQQRRRHAGKQQVVKPGALLSDVQIAGGGGEIAVSQQTLQNRQVHPGFQQMRGETVPQRMDAVMVGQLCPFDRLVKNCLGRLDGQGLAWSVRRGKQPDRRARAYGFLH